MSKVTTFAVGLESLSLLLALQILGVVKCPHASSIVVMWTPKILLLLEFPDWNSIFFSIGIFWFCVLPFPLVVSLFLLRVCVAFILRLFVGLFITFLVGVGSFVVTLLQCLDFCSHGQNLFLFRWCSPGIVLIQQPCFILFSATVMSSSAL